MKIIQTLILFALISVSCNSKKPILPKFNHISLQVSNLDRSVDFYTSAFGLKVSNDSIKHIRYILENDSVIELDVELALLKFPGQDFTYEMFEVKNFDSIAVQGLLSQVGIEVQNIKEAFERAVDAGAKSSIPIRLVQTEGIVLKQALLKGPDDESIELIQIISGEY